jgi:mono/diheme cytochrome c family protein
MFRYFSPLLIAAIMIVPMNAQQSGTKIKSVPLQPTPVTAGKQMYENYCATCHGTTGVGNGSAAPALKTPPANLTLLASKNNGSFPGDHIAAELRFGVTNPAHGSADMPIWGDLFSTMGSDGRDQAKLRIRNITDYLKTLQKN